MNNLHEELGLDPGIQLFEFFRKRFNEQVEGVGLDGVVDRFFNAEGKLLEAERNRIISYTVRRIVHAIKCSMERLDIKSRDTSRMLTCIHEYLIKHTSVSSDESDLEKLKGLILAAIESSSKTMNSTIRPTLLGKAKNAGYERCYICGVDLDFENQELPSSAEVEHHYPQAFGGSSKDPNIRLACRSCNSQKADAIGTYDFHFERISTRHEECHKNWARRLFSSPNALALLLKENCRCSTCGREAAEVGQLKAFRFEPTDSWHYFNIGMNCSDHKSE